MGSNCVTCCQPDGLKATELCRPNCRRYPSTVVAGGKRAVPYSSSSSLPSFLLLLLLDFLPSSEQDQRRSQQQQQRVEQGQRIFNADLFAYSTGNSNKINKYQVVCAEPDSTRRRLDLLNSPIGTAIKTMRTWPIVVHFKEKSTCVYHQSYQLTLDS